MQPLLPLSGVVVKQNLGLAISYYRKAARFEVAEAENCLGLMLEDGEGEVEDIEESLYWYNRSAEHGNGDAVYNIARLYDNSVKGAATLEQNPQLALQLYKKAAVMGVIEAEIKAKKIENLQRLLL